MWSLGVACCTFPGILWMGILHKGHGYRMIQHDTPCCLARCSSLRVLDWVAGLILQSTKSMFFRCGNAGAIKVDAAAKGWWQKEALAWQERSLSVCHSVSCNNRGLSTYAKPIFQNLHGAMTFPPSMVSIPWTKAYVEKKLEKCTQLKKRDCSEQVLFRFRCFEKCWCSCDEKHQMECKELYAWIL